MHYNEEFHCFNTNFSQHTILEEWEKSYFICIQFFIIFFTLPRGMNHFRPSIDQKVNHVNFYSAFVYWVPYVSLPLLISLYTWWKFRITLVYFYNLTMELHIKATVWKVKFTPTWSLISSPAFLTNRASDSRTGKSTSSNPNNCET